MDIAKVRDLTDTELGQRARHAAPPPVRPALPAGHAPADRPQPADPVTRRSIARLLTVMTERGLDENVVARQAAEPAKPAGRVRGRGRTHDQEQGVDAEVDLRR